MLSADYQGKVLVLKLIGELEEDDPAAFKDLLDDKLAGNDDPRILLDLRRYQGAADLGTAWKELKLLISEGDRVNRVAVIGSLDWQKLATLLISPFTAATERFFEPDEIQEALAWLRES